MRGTKIKVLAFLNPPLPNPLPQEEGIKRGSGGEDPKFLRGCIENRDGTILAGGVKLAGPFKPGFCFFDLFSDNTIFSVVVDKPHSL